MRAHGIIDLTLSPTGTYTVDLAQSLRVARNGYLRAKVLRQWIAIIQSEDKPINNLLAQLANALDDEGRV